MNATILKRLKTVAHKVILISERNYDYSNNLRNFNRELEPNLIIPTSKMEENYDEWSFEKTVVYQVELVVVPVLIVTGIVGNLLSAWVLSTSSLRGLSSSFYLASMTASDTGFLASLFFVWINQVGFDVYNKAGWCQGITFVCHVTTFLSVWLVVAFTTERFVAVCFPLLRPRVCTVSRAKIVVASLTMLGCALYSYLLIAAGTVVLSGQQHCTLKSAYQPLGHVMNLVDLVLTLIVPLILIVSLNIKIVRCVKYIEKLRPQLTMAIASKSQPSQLRVTKALLVISTVFVFLNLPSYCVRAYVFFWPPQEASKTLYTVTQATQMLFYANFAVNFQLYCVAGQNFRSAVAVMWQTSCTRRNVDLDIKPATLPLRPERQRRCLAPHSSLVFLASLSRSLTSRQNSGAVDKLQTNSIRVISKRDLQASNDVQPASKNSKPENSAREVMPEISRSVMSGTVMRERENSLPTILRVQLLTSSDLETSKPGFQSSSTPSLIDQQPSIVTPLSASPANLHAQLLKKSDIRFKSVNKFKTVYSEACHPLVLPPLTSSLVSRTLMLKNASSENISVLTNPLVSHSVVSGPNYFSTTKPETIVSLSTLSDTLFQHALGFQREALSTEEPKSAHSNPEFYGEQFSYQTMPIH